MPPAPKWGDYIQASVWAVPHMSYPLNQGQALTGRACLPMSPNHARERAKSKMVQMMWPRTLCPGLVPFTGIDRAHSQRGQDKSTVLECFSTLGTFALLALAMFSHALLLCICSFLSPPPFSPTAPYLCMHVRERWAECKTCKSTWSFSCPLMSGNIYWI